MTLIAIVAATWLALTLFGIGRLLAHKRDPYAMIAWLLFIVAVPFVGAVSFFLFGPQRLAGYGERRARRIAGAARRHPHESSGAWREGDSPERPLRVAAAASPYPLTHGNAAELFADPESALAAIRATIQGARQFVHLEYYIVRRDRNTEAVFKDLADAAQRGVEVRLLYDTQGSNALERRHLKTLEKAGVRVASFLPYRLVVRRLNVNLRNHRKLIVADGRTLITGGTNLSSKYLGRPVQNESRFHDYTFRIDGPAAAQAGEIFAADWFYTTREEAIFDRRYLPDTPPCGTLPVQMLEGTPAESPGALYLTLMELLASAEKEILLVTPYMIPDRTLLTALAIAAKRGVTVRVLVPDKIDIGAVGLVVRSYHEDLLRAGVSVSQYKGPMLHAKLLVVDGKWTLVGSANMDVRSLWLNFELNFLVCGESFAQRAREQAIVDLRRAHPVRLEEVRRRPFRERLRENACRLLAPVM